MKFSMQRHVRAENAHEQFFYRSIRFTYSRISNLKKCPMRRKKTKKERKNTKIIWLKERVKRNDELKYLSATKNKRKFSNFRFVSI